MTERFDIGENVRVVKECTWDGRTHTEPKIGDTGIVTNYQDYDNARGQYVVFNKHDVDDGGWFINEDCLESIDTLDPSDVEAALKSIAEAARNTRE